MLRFCRYLSTSAGRWGTNKPIQPWPWRRIANPYLLFVQEFYEKYKPQPSGEKSNSAKLAPVIAEAWKSLSTAEKQSYVKKRETLVWERQERFNLLDEAEKDKLIQEREKYEKDMAVFKEKQRRKSVRSRPELPKHPKSILHLFFRTQKQRVTKDLVNEFYSLSEEEIVTLRNRLKADTERYYRDMVDTVDSMSEEHKSQLSPFQLRKYRRAKQLLQTDPEIELANYLKPKLPPTPYHLYLREHKLPSRPSSTERFKSLAPEERKKYEDEAWRLKARHKQEMVTWLSNLEHLSMLHLVNYRNLSQYSPNPQQTEGQT